MGLGLTLGCKGFKMGKEGGGTTQSSRPNLESNGTGGGDTQRPCTTFSTKIDTRREKVQSGDD